MLNFTNPLRHPDLQLLDLLSSTFSNLIKMKFSTVVATLAGAAAVESQLPQYFHHLTNTDKLQVLASHSTVSTRRTL